MLDFLIFLLAAFVSLVFIGGIFYISAYIYVIYKFVKISNTTIKRIRDIISK